MLRKFALISLDLNQVNTRLSILAKIALRLNVRAALVMVLADSLSKPPFAGLQKREKGVSQ